jgi:predicted nucleic acid-binding protein
VQAVVDANVWLSASHSNEPDHRHSVLFLREAMVRRIVFLLPALLLPEVAAAAARRTQDPTDGLALTEHLLRLPNARFFELNLTRAQAVAQLASRLCLRGADAQYAALAVECRAPLVTLDHELRDRAARQYDGLTPEEWVARFT